MNQPVLISIGVLAAWMGIDRTDNSLPEHDTVQVRTRLMADQQPTQPHGFVEPIRCLNPVGW